MFQGNLLFQLSVLAAIVATTASTGLRGEEFDHQVGQYFQGGDYKILGANSFDECNQHCQKDKKCAVWSWKEQDHVVQKGKGVCKGTCWLKDKCGKQVPKQGYHCGRCRDGPKKHYDGKKKDGKDGKKKEDKKKEDCKDEKQDQYPKKDGHHGYPSQVQKKDGHFVNYPTAAVTFAVPPTQYQRQGKEKDDCKPPVVPCPVPPKQDQKDDHKDDHKQKPDFPPQPPSQDQRQGKKKDDCKPPVVPCPVPPKQDQHQDQKDCDQKGPEPKQGPKKEEHGEFKPAKLPFIPCPDKQQKVWPNSQQYPKWDHDDKQKHGQDGGAQHWNDHKQDHDQHGPNYNQGKGYGFGHDDSKIDNKHWDGQYHHQIDKDYKFDFKIDWDFFTNDYKHCGADTFDDCHKLCKDEGQQCGAWTWSQKQYDGKNGTCHLKTKYDEGEKKEGMICGKMQQQGH